MAKKKKPALKKKSSVKASPKGTRKPAAKATSSRPAKKKTAVKKAPAAKRKVVAAPKKGKGAAKPAKKAVKKSAPAAKKTKTAVPKYKAAEIREFRQLLLNLRDKVVDGISFLAGDNLNRSQRDASGDLSGYSMHMADQGTDNFDREFALNMVSSEQDVLYEIDEAIRRCDQGSYGVCEMTGELIEKERLKIIPYARYSVAYQKTLEKGKTRYRPFGPTLSHGG